MIERKIIIASIVSKEFLQQVSAVWSTQYFESNVPKKLGQWIIEYFQEFNDAPGREIENIFYEKIRKANFSKELAEEIEQDILPSLSQEYEDSEINIPHLVKLTKKYFSERKLLIHSQSIQALVEKGDIAEAEKMAIEFIPLDTSTNNLSNFILSLSQIRRQKREPAAILVKSWLKTGECTILYGSYGSGKSLLSILLAYWLGMEAPEDFDIGEWEVRHGTGTLYIDGELGEAEMQERIEQFEWMGDQERQFRMRVLSIPEYQMATEDSFYLGDRKNQLKIIEWLKDHPNYKLIVLDSVSTLFGLVEENDNSEWSNKINPFLRDLRALGVACLLLHHAGKDGKKGLRGASAMGAMAHNIFRLSNHEGKNVDDGEAWFTISKDKQRSAGFSFKRFSLKFTQDEEAHKTQWRVTKNTDV